MLPCAIVLLEALPFALVWLQQGCLDPGPLVIPTLLTE